MDWIGLASAWRFSFFLPFYLFFVLVYFILLFSLFSSFPSPPFPFFILVWFVLFVLLSYGPGYKERGHTLHPFSSSPSSSLVIGHWSFRHFQAQICLFSRQVESNLVEGGNWSVFCFWGVDILFYYVFGMLAVSFCIYSAIHLRIDV